MAKLLLPHQRSAFGPMRYLLTTASRLHTELKPSVVDSSDRNPCRQTNAGICQTQKLNVDIPTGFKWKNWVHGDCSGRRRQGGLLVSGRSQVWTYLNHYLGSHSFNCRSLHLTWAYSCNIPAQLPPFRPAEDEKLGPTIITDMSQEDQLRIKFLAYEDMKTFLSDNKVKYKSRKTADMARQGTKMFGTALSLLANMDIRAKKIHPNFKVPLLFKLFLGHIHMFGHDTPGVLKISGSDEKVKLLKDEIEEKFNAERKFRISGNYSVHDVSSTFKHFLQELPVPLITTDKIELFPEIFSLDFLEKQLVAMNLYILMMNPEHRDSLESLLCFMSALTDDVNQNQMDEDELGKVMAPFVFKPGDDPARLNKLANALRAMIHYNVLLFYVPPSLIKKLRYQYAKGEPPKPQPGFLFGKKTQKELEQDRRMDAVSLAKVKVHAPDLPTTLRILDMNDFTKAGDLLKEYINQSTIERRTMVERVERRVDIGIDATPLEEFHLYEMNGNIGHRLIHPETKVIDVYRVNPRADFVITKRSKLV